MKLLSFHPRDLLIHSMALVVAYAILFQIMIHTRMIEKVMALTFSWWELLLIASFLVTRILTYLLVPALLGALAVYSLMRWILEHGIGASKSGEGYRPDWKKSN